MRTCCVTGCGSACACAVYRLLRSNVTCRHSQSSDNSTRWTYLPPLHPRQSHRRIAYARGNWAVQPSAMQCSLTMALVREAHGAKRVKPHCSSKGDYLDIVWLAVNMQFCSLSDAYSVPTKRRQAFAADKPGRDNAVEQYVAAVQHFTHESTRMLAYYLRFNFL